MGVEGADGDGNSGAQAQPRGPLRAEVSGDLVAGGVAPAKLRADAGERGIETRSRNSSGGSPPRARFHIHLWPMAQTLRETCAGSVMPQRTAATISQCSSAVAKRARLSGLWRSQWSSLAKPHSLE